MLDSLDVSFDLLSFRKHSDIDIVCVKDKHPPFSTPTYDYAVFVYDEAVVVSEPDLHGLVDNLSNRHQVLSDCRHLQDIPYVTSLSDVA